MSHRECAIDLTGGGRWWPRLSNNWRSEFYFMEAEEALQTRRQEYMNVTHCLDPARVSAEALALLQKAFAQSAADCLKTGPWFDPASFY